jgi:hypothetical protein
MNNDGWMNNGIRKPPWVHRGTHVSLPFTAVALELKLLAFNYGADKKQSISPE